MIPQILMIAWLAIFLGACLSKHGERVGRKISFGRAVFIVVVEALLLWWGGFWDVFTAG